jgi:hypothetical protein
MRKISLVSAVAITAATLSLSAPAQAAELVLDFEGVGNLNPVGNYYNGGAGGDYGISFSDNSLGLVDSDAGGSGNTSNEPSPETVLFFLTGGSAIMNVTGGFDTGFSFFYSAPYFTGTVNVYDQLNGAGNIIGTLPLALTGDTCGGDPNGNYNCWSPIGVNFSGTAYSVGFGGTENYIVFDNITLGSATPGTGGVPEPATWAMMLMGFGGAGFALRRSRRSKPLLQLA